MNKEINSNPNKDPDSKHYVESETKHKSKADKIVLIGIITLIAIIVLLYLEFNKPGHGKSVAQKAQFNSTTAALELFKSEFDYYPPSDALDKDAKPYCGTMKLAESMMGQDLFGFHPDSIFRKDGTDGHGRELYPLASSMDPEQYNANVSARKGPYLQLESANAYPLRDIYENVGPFDGNTFVICDTYKQKRHADKKIGMPILYYKARTSKTAHDINDPNNPENIYNYKDNHTLLALGVPGQPDKKHPLFEDPKIFYEITKDYEAAEPNKPHKADSFILISAGKDGLYGTKDDITNFEWRWKPTQERRQSELEPTEFKNNGFLHRKVSPGDFRRNDA